MLKNQLQTLIALGIGILVLLTVILTLIYGNNEANYNVTEVRDVNLTVNGTTREASMPLTLNDLPHQTEVRLSFTIPAKSGNTFFFSSVYSPLTILFDGNIVYEYGKPGTYPFFFGDPPTQYASIGIPIKHSVQVEMIYHSPNERRTLSIHAPVLGSDSAIIGWLMSRYAFTLSLSLFFLFLGVVLITMSPFFLRLENQSQSLLQPGLLCFLAGAWQFGENSFSVYLVQSPSILYVMDFLGMFLLAIPLYKLGMHYLKLESNRLLKTLLYVMEISVIIAILLQLTGIVSFHRSLYYFHYLIPGAIMALTGTTLYEYLHNKNRLAGIFFILFLILAVAAILELINYRLHFMSQFSSIFQLGLFMFVLAMAFFSGITIRNMYASQFRNLTLENELKLQEQTISAQKMRNELLLNNYEEIRRQRHDIRHHLRTLSGMLQKGETRNAYDYIQELASTVPVYTPEKYCSNLIINATLGYYNQLAKENNIDLKIHVQVPESNPNISDSNLCVIFGNLLENATEACSRMKSGARYITLNSQVRGEVLFITMDNSYDGNVSKKGERFYSSKRPGFGTGLSSVQSLAETHNGSASFEALENEFRSEVYVRL